MSTTPEYQHQHEEGTQRVSECDRPGCLRVGRPWTFQHGYCSTEHWYQHEGRKALADLKYSHTRCFTCLATLKEIEPPKDAVSDFAFVAGSTELAYDPETEKTEWTWTGQRESQQAACGFQYLTPDATLGEKNAGKKVITGTTCGECGATDHTEHIAMLADGHRTAGVVVNYLATERDEEGGDEFDPETLHRQYRTTGDLELATGAAIVACRE